MAFDPTTMSAEDLAAALAFVKQSQAAERNSRKQDRENSRTWQSKFVRTLMRLDGATTGIRERKFADKLNDKGEIIAIGATGWNFGGKDIPVVIDDEGTVRNARVSVLIRWEDTIPASDKSETPDA